MKKVIHPSTRISSYFTLKVKIRYWLISQFYRVAGSPSIFALCATECNSSDIWVSHNAVFLINLHEARMVKKVSRKKSEKNMLNMEWHFFRYGGCNVCVMLEGQIYLWWNFSTSESHHTLPIASYIQDLHVMHQLKPISLSIRYPCYHE